MAAGYDQPTDDSVPATFCELPLPPLPRRDIRADCTAALNAVSIRACYLAGQLLTSCEVIE